ncbi:hypothetical protein Tco_0725875 [Tanacetum coccineum]|uniref:Uncharacterized protein n=1 Tax=Tanacetum coccineum TaxID=301880 RepID=A0ABQ4YE56_9ASTR
MYIPMSRGASVPFFLSHFNLLYTGESILQKAGEGCLVVGDGFECKNSKWGWYMRGDGGVWGRRIRGMNRIIGKVGGELGGGIGGGEDMVCGGVWEFGYGLERWLGFLGFADTILELEDDGTFSFQLGGARRQMSWRQSILALGLHTTEEIDIIRDLLRRLYHRLIAHTIAGRGHAPEKVTRTDLYFLRSMDQEAVNLLYFLAHYLFRHAEGRKWEA